MRQFITKALTNRDSTDVKLFVVQVKSKLNRNTGSQILRKWVAHVTGEKRSYFSSAELDYVAKELKAMGLISPRDPSNAVTPQLDSRTQAASSPSVVNLGTFTGTANQFPLQRFADAVGDSWKKENRAMPAWYPSIAEAFGRLFTEVEKQTGKIVHVTHTLRGGTSRSNHDPENGATAVDFRSIDGDNQATRMLADAVLDFLERYRVPYHQFIYETLSSGRHLIHLDLKPTNKRQAVTANVSSMRTVFTGNYVKSTISGTLDMASDINTWINAVYARAQSHGVPEVSRALSSPEAVRKILEIEGGIVNGQLVLDASNGYYFGPFQVGTQAWKDGPATYSPFKSPSTLELRSLTQRKAKGGPSDLAVMAPGIIDFFNKQVSYMGPDRDKMHWDINALYAVHNQGAGGVRHYLRTGSIRFPKQSDAAIRAIKSLRRA